MRLITCFALCVCAVAQPHTFYPEPALPSGWANQFSKAVGHDAANIVKVTLAVREQNMDKIREIALDVSNPDSPIYGKYLSQAQVDEITAPTAVDVAAVRSWLTTEQFPGNVEESQAGHFFVLTAPAVAVAALLKTKFRRVTNAATSQTTLRASSFALPTAAADAVTAVFGVHGLPLPPKRNRVMATDGIPSVTPTVLASTYNVAGVTVDRSGKSKNRQAVAEFQGQTMNSTDLATFFKNEVPRAHAGDDVVSKFVGDRGDSSAKIEASLDIQFIMGVAPGVKTEFW
jgi:tripeptidyl-peptidase-1